jgi:hypothetical protein
MSEVSRCEICIPFMLTANYEVQISECPLTGWYLFLKLYSLRGQNSLKILLYCEHKIMQDKVLKKLKEMEKEN